MTARAIALTVGLTIGAALTIAACGQPTQRHVELPPTSDVTVTIPDDSESTTTSAQFGKPIVFSPNLTVSVDAPEVGEPDPQHGRPLTIRLSATNATTGSPTTMPAIGITCANAAAPGGFRTDTDMLRPASPLPPQTAQFGDLTLFLPKLTCAAPAYIQIRAGDAIRRVPIPSTTLTALTQS